MNGYLRIFNEESVEETAILNMVAFILWTISTLAKIPTLGWIAFVITVLTLLFNAVALIFTKRIKDQKIQLITLRRRINQIVFSICFIIIFWGLRFLS